MAPQRVFARIRSMDALAFEELILEAFETRGMPVKRSQRYTGDGGFDGQIMHKNKWVLLQMKRYKGPIAVSDVKAFAKLCRKHGQTGFFVHSGKTTSGSKAIIDADSNLEVISGQRLVDLLTTDSTLLDSMFFDTMTRSSNN